MIGTGQQSQPLFCYFGSRRFSSLATNGRNGWKAVIKEAMLICIEKIPWPHRCVYGPMPGGSSQSTGWWVLAKAKKIVALAAKQKNTPFLSVLVKKIA